MSKTVEAMKAELQELQGKSSNGDVAKGDFFPSDIADFRKHPITREEREGYLSYIGTYRNQLVSEISLERYAEDIRRCHYYLANYKTSPSYIKAAE